MHKAERLLKELLFLCQAGNRGLSVNGLSRLTGARVRTIRRDITALSYLVPIYEAHEGSTKCGDGARYAIDVVHLPGTFRKAAGDAFTG